MLLLTSLWSPHWVGVGVHGSPAGASGQVILGNEKLFSTDLPQIESLQFCLDLVSLDS